MCSTAEVASFRSFWGLESSAESFQVFLHASAGLATNLVCIEIRQLGEVWVGKIDVMIYRLTKAFKNKR